MRDRLLMAATALILGSVAYGAGLLLVQQVSQALGYPVDPTPVVQAESRPITSDDLSLHRSLLATVEDLGAICLYASPGGLWGIQKRALDLEPTEKCPGQ